MSGLMATCNIAQEKTEAIMESLKKRGPHGSLYHFSNPLSIGYTHYGDTSCLPESLALANGYYYAQDGVVGLPSSDEENSYLQAIHFITANVNDHNCLDNSCLDFLEIANGSFSFVLISPQGTIIGGRDVRGGRPLAYAFNKVAKAFALASETANFASLGRDFEISLLEPGQIVVYKSGMPKPRKWQRRVEMRQEPCGLNAIYLMKPDSWHESRIIPHESEALFKTRFKWGHTLAYEFAQEKTPPSDVIVLGVPNSGIPAAYGFASYFGLPFAEDGIITNPRYGERVFTRFSQEERYDAARKKFRLNCRVLGRIVYAIDDSVVRGTNMTRVVELLRREGAKEVHVFSASPTIVNGCPFEIPIAPSELLMRGRTLEDAESIIGADSLRFLSLEAFKKQFPYGVCTHCFE